MKANEFLNLMDEVMLTKKEMTELEKKYSKDSHMTGELDLSGLTEDNHVVKG